MVTGIVTEKIGEVLSNSIRINELTPDDLDNTESTYVRIGAARSKKGDLYIAEFIINKTTNEMEMYSIMHSVNAKKEPAASLPVGEQESPTPLTGSDISIAELLTYVNETGDGSLFQPVARRTAVSGIPVSRTICLIDSGDAFSLHSLACSSLYLSLSWDRFDVKKMKRGTVPCFTYFEAKPRRVVTPDEALSYIIPDNTAPDVIRMLDEQGLSYVTYEAGNSEDRLAKLNSVETAKFSDREDNNTRRKRSRSVEVLLGTLYNENSLNPTSQAEIAAFNRSFANKTSHLHDGQSADIVIFAGGHMYAVRADGYMTGTIVGKKAIRSQSDYRELIERFNDGNNTSGTPSSVLPQDVRSSPGRGGRNGIVSEYRAANSTDQVDVNGEDAYGKTDYDEGYGYDLFEGVRANISEGTIELLEDGTILTKDGPIYPEGHPLHGILDTDTKTSFSERDNARTDRELLMETDAAELTDAERTALDAYRKKVESFEDLERQVKAQQEVLEQLTRDGAGKHETGDGSLFHDQSAYAHVIRDIKNVTLRQSFNPNTGSAQASSSDIYIIADLFNAVNTT